MKARPVPLNRKLGALTACILISNLLVAYGSGSRTRLADPHSLSLKAASLLDSHSIPVISCSGKVGFVSATADGELIAFSTGSGKLLSSVVVGQSAGPATMVETESRRLIAVASPNAPEQGFPATISIIDATSAKGMNIVSVTALPSKTNLTTASRVLLTSDGRYGVIASSFDEPELICFDTETGEIVSTLPLLGRPSETALYDSGRRRLAAVTSAVSNMLTVVKVSSNGELRHASSFSPSEGSFDEANNPAFSSDGKSVYVATSSGDLYAVRAASGAETGRLRLGGSTRRINVASTPDHRDQIAVTRIRRPAADKPSGVSIVVGDQGNLAPQSEFSPPSPIEFSNSNNPVIHESGTVAFVASETGVLFAFDTATGEMESYQYVGGELMGMALTAKGRSVAVVRRAPDTDQIVVLGFDSESPDKSGDGAPVIQSLSPDVVEQGRLKNLSLVITGENFTPESQVFVDGQMVTAVSLTRKGKALTAKVSKLSFQKAGNISITVKNADGVASIPALLQVVKPNSPVIDQVLPGEVPGPSGPFKLRVFGSNYRPSAMISVLRVGDGSFGSWTALHTERVSDTKLVARIEAELVKNVGDLKIRVEDIAISDLVSNEKTLTVFGPRIDTLTPSVATILAGGPRFKLDIAGVNFRDGAEVEINGAAVPEHLIRRPRRGLIKAVIPARFVQNAGKLLVVVKNPDDSRSEPKALNALGPKIIALGPQELLAGDADLSLRITGENFHKRARVLVSVWGENGNVLEVDRERVRFRSSSVLTISFGPKLNQLIAQRGQLNVQVVNPNNGDGVPSEAKELKVLGPEVTEARITSVEGNTALDKLVIEGANFRKGAILEFVKEGQVQQQISPDTFSVSHLVATVKKKRIDGLGSFSVQVVNPGGITSNQADPVRQWVPEQTKNP